MDLGPPARLTSQPSHSLSHLVPGTAAAGLRSRSAFTGRMRPQRASVDLAMALAIGPMPSPAAFGRMRPQRDASAAACRPRPASIAALIALSEELDEAGDSIHWGALFESPPIHPPTPFEWGTPRSPAGQRGARARWRRLYVPRRVLASVAVVSLLATAATPIAWGAFQQGRTPATSSAASSARSQVGSSDEARREGANGLVPPDADETARAFVTTPLDTIIAVVANVAAQTASSSTVASPATSARDQRNPAPDADGPRATSDSGTGSPPAAAPAGSGATPASQTDGSSPPVSPQPTAPDGSSNPHPATNTPSSPQVTPAPAAAQAGGTTAGGANGSPPTAAPAAPAKPGATGVGAAVANVAAIAGVATVSQNSPPPIAAATVAGTVGVKGAGSGSAAAVGTTPSPASPTPTAALADPRTGAAGASPTTLPAPALPAAPVAAATPAPSLPSTVPVVAPLTGGVSSIATPSPVVPVPTPLAAVPDTTGGVSGGDHTKVDAWLEAAGWPANLIPQARQVAWCESRWQPSATNGHARGLFQLWQGDAWGWFTVFGVDPNSWSDPVANARLALQVYRYDLDHGQSPWTQWTCKP